MKLLADDGALHHGDCLDVLRSLPARSVDLVYLDPPFCSQRLWTGAAGSFDDRWPSLYAYIEFMRERAVELRRVLTMRGVMYLHADPNRASHYLGVMCADVFGEKNVVGNIVWVRTSAHGKPGRKFGPVHDNIIVCERSAGAHELRESHDDIWDDLRLSSRAGERVGYPTQKPVALLERIIAMSSDPADVVLDPFCGSGTTLVAARKLGRRWVGIDESADAIATSRKRLATVHQLRLNDLTSQPIGEQDGEPHSARLPSRRPGRHPGDNREPVGYEPAAEAVAS